MTTCTLNSPLSLTLAPSRGARILAWIARYFSQSVVTREAIDHAWIDSGLGRLSRATLEDIGAPSSMIDAAAQREAWKLASSLDATRLL
jgi:hypothetical protein